MCVDEGDGNDAVDGNVDNDYYDEYCDDGGDRDDGGVLVPTAAMMRTTMIRGRSMAMTIKMLFVCRQKKQESKRKRNGRKTCRRNRGRIFNIITVMEKCGKT